MADPGPTARPAAGTPPVLNSQQLRKIAEAVSGYRGEPQYWLVLTQGDDGELEHRVLPRDPGPLSNAVVIPCRTPKEADRPHVVSATIRAEGGPELNLLNLKLEDDEGDVVHRADAVFWGESAVEKFVVPYYASVYGSDAGEAVTELLDAYNGVAADTRDTNTATVYGLVHIPRSEYIELDPAAEPVAPARLDRFAVLAFDRATGAHRVVTVEEYQRRRGEGRRARGRADPGR